jgi:hypothetical protein
MNEYRTYATKIKKKAFDRNTRNRRVNIFVAFIYFHLDSNTFQAFF